MKILSVRRKWGMATVRTGFGLVLFLFVASAFLAHQGFDPRQPIWVFGLAMLLTLLAVGLLFSLAVKAQQTQLGSRVASIGLLVLFVGYVTVNIAMVLDDAAFFATMAGIGAGVVTQAAFHYGLVHPAEPQWTALQPGQSPWWSKRAAGRPGMRRPATYSRRRRVQ